VSDENHRAKRKKRGREKYTLLSSLRKRGEKKDWRIDYKMEEGRGEKGRRRRGKREGRRRMTSTWGGNGENCSLAG